MPPAKGWHALLHHWSKDAQLWLLIVVSLQLFRLLLIGVFSAQAGVATGAAEYLVVVGNGLRYDISTAAIWVLPTFLLSISTAFIASGRPLAALRRFSAGLYMVAAPLLFGADLIFFDEYADQFNQMIFGIAHDDTVAILITIWKEYHPLIFLALALPTIALGLWAVRRWLAYTPAWLTRQTDSRAPLRRTATALAIFIGFVALARGGSLWGEPIRLKHAFVVNDLFLNRTVLNPFSAMRYALKTKLELERSGGLAAFWPSKDIRAALAEVSPAQAAAGDIDAALARSAHGAPGPAPRHIFLVLGESISGWPVMPEYRHAGLTPRLNDLAERGLYFQNFLPSSGGTIGSLNAILTGMPDAGLQINHATSAGKPYPSAIAETFRRLGYRTRFFYGGYLSWQRLDSFAQAQGFDEIWGGGSMADGEATNEWGVDDAALYRFILNKVEDQTPSFNFILTTTNHPPYDLDLEALGYPVEKLPPELTPTKAETMKVLGHLWYSDGRLGEFVEQAEQRFDRALFAITGDHTARLQIRFPGDNVAEQLAVPLVLYGPQVLDGAAKPATAGSHIDIPPTLIELAAPQGFAYHSFGQSLLHKASPSFGLGLEFLIGEDLISSLTQPPHLYRLPGQSETASAGPRLDSAIQRFNALRALSWYRVRKGSQLAARK